MSAETEAGLDQRLLHRMMFFTDAVFAIVMTLLVLELKPPAGFSEATPATFEHAVPHIFAFVMSFLLAAIFWAAHLNTTRRLIQFDWPTAWANLLLLLPVCLLPYVSGWFGASISGAYAWRLYCWVLVACSVANMILVLVAMRDRGRLIAGGATPRQRAYRLLRAAGPGVAFGIGLVMLEMGHTIPSHFCALLIPPLYMLAGRMLKPRAAPAATAGP